MVEQLDYDTVISMIVPNIECIEKMRQDPDFLYKFIPDHFNFADMTQSRWVSSSFPPCFQVSAMILTLR